MNYAHTDTTQTDTDRHHCLCLNYTDATHTKHYVQHHGEKPSLAATLSSTGQGASNGTSVVSRR